tara:strand:- start:3573 stop:3791 length:219 start_codon:yes stop_codon:yes gene_type:complete
METFFGGIVLAISCFVGIGVVIPFLQFIRKESHPTTKDKIVWFVFFIIWLWLGIYLKDNGIAPDWDKGWPNY